MRVSCRIQAIYSDQSSRLHASRFMMHIDSLQILTSGNMEAAQAMHCIAQHFSVESDLVDHLEDISEDDAA